MEFSAELSEIYGELYEIELKNKKKTMESINHLAKKSIDNGKIFTDIIYEKDDPQDKFEYYKSMLNLELNAGSKLTKWITADAQERIDKTKQALDIYKKLNNYLKEYMKWKEIDDFKDIPGGNQVQE